VVAVTRGAQRRHRTDQIAILTGLGLLGLAIWPGSPSASTGAAIESGVPDVLWLVHALAGGMTLLGVTVAQSWGLRQMGRSLIVIAAVGLIAVLFQFNQIGLRALLTVALPATLLLVAAFSVGLPREI
jgi:hypothetical protein